MSEIVTTEKQKTGRLISIGIKKYCNIKYEFRACVDCGTEYIVMGGRLMCNDHEISLCPWCRPDSRPWFAGRGA